MKEQYRVSAIAAIGENRELGANNDLPWGRALPTDMERFRNKVREHTIISGRRTFESMGSKPLPDRTNIVVSREPDYKPEGVIVVPSVEEAIAEAKKHKTKDGEIFVIGGGKIYELALPHVGRLYLTLIHASFPNADVYFPDYSEFKKVVHREPPITESGYTYEFVDLERG